MAVDEKKADHVRGWRAVWSDVAEQMEADDAPDYVLGVLHEIAGMERPAGNGKVRVEFDETDLRLQLKQLPEDDLHGVIRHIAYVRNAHERGGQVVVTVLIDTLLERFFDYELARRNATWTA